MAADRYTERIAGDNGSGALALAPARVGPVAPPRGLAANRYARLLGIGAVLVAAVSFGVQGILGKYATAGGASVATLLTVRWTVAGAIVWAILLLLRGRNRGPALRQPARKLLGFGVLGLLFVTNSVFYFLALELLPVGVTVLLVYLFPALVVLWSVLFFGERLDRARGGALALALLGSVLTIDPAAAFATGAAFSALGVALALGSALSNSWCTTLMAPIGRGVPGLIVNAYSLPVTAAVCGGYALAAGGFGGMSRGAWLICLAIGALTGLSAYVILHGIARIGASRAAIVMTAEPVTAVTLSALLFAEALTPLKLLGGACIVAGILLLSRQRAARA